MSALTAFETRMANLIDAWKQHEKMLHCAASGFFDPGILAEEVFGERLEPGQLFLYLFRRFGAPVDPIDDYKQCAAYMYTTPRSDVWLTVSITATERVSLQFGYCITSDLGERLRREERNRIDAWHREKERWCREQGMDLPVLPPYPTHETCPTEDAWYNALFALTVAQKTHKTILDEAFTRYTLAHPEKERELHETRGILWVECHGALLATLRDLTRPTYCRDIYFTPIGCCDEGADFGYDEARDITLYRGQPCAEYTSDAQKSRALRQAEADIFADSPIEGCSRCVDKANELYALRVQLDAAERQRYVLARKLMEDNTSLEYGHEFPEEFTPRFEPETDEHAVRFWIEWAEQKVAEEQE